MSRFRCQPLELPAERERIARADLIFYGVDHSGPSYEGRVFLGNGRVSEETPLEAAKGYAGSFVVFGHGGCFGGEGHCAPKERTVDEFDRRPPHPLEPQTISLTITEALAHVKGETVRVTVVPVIERSEAAPSGSYEVSAFERVRLATYA